VTAIVLSFASGYLGLGWQWLRPTAELLLLAELVGLIVLERHQLFEPTSEKIRGIETRVNRIDTALETLAEHLTAAGQATLYANSSQTLSATGFQEIINALLAFGLKPGSPPDSKASMWSCRFILNMPNLETFNLNQEKVRPLFVDPRPLNNETKLVVRSRVEAVLSPSLVTDREVLLTFDDINSPARWGLLLQGPQYVAVFARWFDELWASIPDTYLVYSRSGTNLAALDRIRQELEAVEASRERRTA
jgi:hypothetical protein